MLYKMMESKQGTRTYKKYSRMISSKKDGTPWNENEIIYFRKYLRNLNQRDFTGMLILFRYNMPEGGYSIETSHEDKGTEYLKRKTFKLNGNLRVGNIFNTTGINILKTNLISHKFVDLDFQSSHILPIYKMTSLETNQSIKYTGTIYSCIRLI